MKSELSKLARQLRSLPVPIRCRTPEEREGVERTAAACARCGQLGIQLHEQYRKTDWLRDEIAQKEADRLAAEIVVLAAEVMQRLAARLPIEKEDAARATWTAAILVHFVPDDAALPKDDAGDAPPAEPAESPGDASARQLETYYAKLINDPALEAREVAEAAREFLAFDRDRLAALQGDCPQDFLAELLHVPLRDAGGTWIGPDAVERASALAAESRAAAHALGQTLEEADEVALRLYEELMICIPDLTRFLPGTGETADLIELLRVPQLAFTPPDQRPAFERPFTCHNRVYARLAVTLALASVRWGAEAREALAYLVQHPNAFARWQPPTAAGRDAKAALRDLRDCFKGQRPPHEIDSLLAVLADPRSTDAEIAWIVGEYIVARYGGAGEVRAMGAVGRKLERAFNNLLAASTVQMIVLFGQVRPYDGARHLRTAVDAEIEQLEAAERAELDTATARFTPPRPARPASAAPPPPAPRRIIHLRYLQNPEADCPHEVKVDCPEDAAFAEIQSLLDEHADTPVPTPSLARAIHHFAFATPEAHRQTWNKERVGPHTYHKLKRGAARIYVRVEGATIHFHAYARKNWEKWVG